MKHLAAVACTGIALILVTGAGPKVAVSGARAATPAPVESASTRIAFSGRDSGGAVGIYVMDPDGTNARAITQGPVDTGPSWSPDGKKIAFVRNVAGHIDNSIETIDPDDATGGSLEQLTQGFQDYGPAWSADGSRIAFTRVFPGQSPDSADPGNPAHIFVMSADGTNLLDTGARGNGFALKLSWSPDGNQIVYNRQEHGVNRIAIVAADGSGGSQTLPTDACQPWGVGNPAWSPDGTRIVFLCVTHGGEEGHAWIAQIDPSGGHFTQLTDAPEAGAYPDWSPDGSKIVYSDNVTGHIVVMDADGSNHVDVGTGGAQRAAQPDWGKTGPCTGLSGHIEDGHGDVMPSLKVELVHGVDPVGAPVATDKDGKYCIPATTGTISGDDFTILASLTDGDHNPPLYHTVKDGEGDQVAAELKVTAADVGRTDVDIDFTDDSRPWLSDVAAIHYESNRFIHWLLDTVGVPAAAFIPLKIVTFGPDGEAAAHYSPDTHQVTIASRISGYSARDDGTDECPENCEWHELAHHLALMWHIAEAGSDDVPACADRTNHAGWLNPSTCDSLQEGFAMWLATVASLDLDTDRGGNYGTPAYATFGSLEADSYYPWDLYVSDGEVLGDEDLAVSQLLWDLADNTSTESLLIQSWDAQASQCTSFFGATDSIRIGAIPLLQFLGQSPPQTVADLYDELQVTSTVPRGQRIANIDINADGNSDVSSLDAVFLNHGFNPVPDLNSPCYRPGSGTSRTDHVPDPSGGLIQRRDKPETSNSAINFTNDASTDATYGLDVTYRATATQFEVHVPAHSSKLVHVEVPPYWSAALPANAPLPDCGATDERKVTLKLSGPGVPDRTITNCEFLHAVALATDGAAVTYGAQGVPSPGPTTPTTTAAPAAPAAAATPTSISPPVLFGAAGALLAALIVGGVVFRRKRRIS